MFMVVCDTNSDVIISRHIDEGAARRRISALSRAIGSDGVPVGARLAIDWDALNDSEAPSRAADNTPPAHTQRAARLAGQ